MWLASIILMTFIASGNIFSQTKTNHEDRKTALDIDFLMGSGYLVEVDPEFMLTKQFGLINRSITWFFLGGYHPKARINSSFISLQYMHQGLWDAHYADYIKPMYNFRTRKIFQAGIRIG